MNLRLLRVLLFVAFIALIGAYVLVNCFEDSVLSRINSIAQIIGNITVPIIGLITIFMTVRINNTLLDQGKHQDQSNKEHSMRMASMNVRLEIFKDLKEDFDKMVSITQHLAEFPRKGVIPKESIHAFRIWDDKQKQYHPFFPETFRSIEAHALVESIIHLQRHASPSVQLSILNNYDLFIARMAREITEATIIEREKYIIEKSDGSQEEITIG